MTNTTELIAAVENLIKVKGRYHSEQAYKRLVEAFDAYQAGRASAVPEGICKWELTDYEQAIWESGCGQSWTFIDGGPEENGAHFCHGCGGKIEIAAAPQEKEGV